jgi:hypothetical protein
LELNQNSNRVRKLQTAIEELSVTFFSRPPSDSGDGRKPVFVCGGVSLNLLMT